MNPFRNRDPHDHDIESAPDLAPTILAIETAYYALVPTMRFNRAAAAAIPDITPPGAHRRWKPALALAAIALIALAAVAAPLTRDGHPQTVNAKELLAKAEAATIAGAGPYHTVGRSFLYNVTVGVREDQQSEMWYRDPDHIRLEFHALEPDGTQGRLLGGFLRNGDDVWHWSEDGGTDHGTPIVRASHGSTRSALGAIVRDGLWDSPGDLTAAFKKYLSNCTTPAVTGSAHVAGRAAYVVEACGSTIWIDKLSFFVLKVQEPPSSLTPTPDSLGTYYVPGGTEVSTLEFLPTMDDSIFAYTPPPGTVIYEQPDLP